MGPSINTVGDEAARAHAEWFKTVFERAGWTVLGPVPYPLARLNDEWRYRIAVKTRDLDALERA